ncbi:DUF624 domain-containing protein [Sporolactobacillus kofuensis]|uniref:DUF624 domain-containing protein n=1 Tax=Sporolactobacillus kofuensis TaxID=269672 RepID=A0ABW1WF52_9BACL|nr:DUF624 domain-containing protein [Sporolactobacillus kofuensis]MCO7176037.1 DUF624 domain-containing protein [Sporolactobacillus kofuensis]
MNWMHFSDQLIKWVYLILKLTGIWWLFNSPYAFLGAVLLLVHDPSSVHSVFITSVALLPFVAIPALVAMLATARRYGRDDRSFSFLKSFWSYYRRDYKKSIILGGVNTGMLILFYFASRYYAELSSLLTAVFYLLLFVTPFFFLLVYSFLVDQQLSLKTYFSNTIFLSLKHPLNTLLMIMDIVVAIFLMWKIFPPLLVLVLPGLVALVTTHFYQKSMDTEIRKQQPSA